MSYDGPFTHMWCPVTVKKNKPDLIFNDILFILYTAILYPFVLVRRS